MSYSDYGGFAWKLGTSGIWERYPPAEDGTLIGVEAPSERPLEEKTGLKLDVLINAYQKQGLDYGKDSQGQSCDDWIVRHPHHCVLGSMRGIGLVGHKGSVTVTVEGKEVKRFPDWLGGNKSPYKSQDEEEVDLGAWKYALKLGESLSSYCMMLLHHADGPIYAGVSGYGIGEHWWKDEDGYERLRPGDRIQLIRKARLYRPRRSRPHILKVARKRKKDPTIVSPIGMSPEDVKKLEKKYELIWCWDSLAFEEDKKKLGLDEDDDFENLGRKPVDPWPSYEDWRLKVMSWADPIVRKWKGENACPRAT